MEIKHIKGGTDNCYLIADGKKAVLVDTASKQCLNQVIAECDKYELQLIVLTHVHFDHAENAAELSRRYNVPVALHEADEELFESFDRQPLKSYGLVGRVVLGLSLKVLRETTVERPEKIIHVKEGDSLSEYGLNAKIVELPGHTNGSIGVDVEEKHLFVGDALDNWISPATGHLYFNIDDIRKTAKKIKALGNRTLYYGHGKPTTDFKEKI
ncbi:MAG: MBL fold metallo-hydrolase [Treponema sp.]|nr:MBL fold metallo-hydrolase [Treponema sp.]